MAYRSGSIPVGAVFVDRDGKIRWRGRNRVREVRADDGASPVLVGNRLAHAEVNCLVQAPRQLFEEMSRGTLYTTLEPCPLCVGAVVMAGVRRVVYAARDGWAGATHLLRVPGYTASKEVAVEGPRPGWETVSLALNAASTLRWSLRADDLLRAFAGTDPGAVALGERWHASRFLDGERSLDEVLSAAGVDG
jgi:tRNA(adenine34) deaminase